MSDGAREAVEELTLPPLSRNDLAAALFGVQTRLAWLREQPLYNQYTMNEIAISEALNRKLNSILRAMDPPPIHEDETNYIGDGDEPVYGPTDEARRIFCAWSKRDAKTCGNIRRQVVTRAILRFYPVEYLWPEAVARTPPDARTAARYQQSLDQALGSLRGVVAAKFQADEAEVGLERSRIVYDPAAVVRFEDAYKRVITLACDRYSVRQHNVRALVYALEALWRLERDGSSQIFEQVVRGQAVGPALPPPVPWPWSELGVRENASRAAVDAAYRARAKEMHPDSGGDATSFQRLRSAYEAAIKEERA